MVTFSAPQTDEVVQQLLAGGVGILRTDTLYGLVARAHDQAAVERVYEIKTRTPTKPPIVLIGSTEQLLDTYDAETLMALGGVWPGKNSVILPSQTGPIWLTRGSASIAYRLPDDEQLRQLLLQTGPLIAPSANPEGLSPAMTVAQAQAYFGESVDFYCDGGEVIDDTPSRLYRLSPDGLERLR